MTSSVGDARHCERAEVTGLLISWQPANGNGCEQQWSQAYARGCISLQTGRQSDDCIGGPRLHLRADSLPSIPFPFRGAAAVKQTIMATMAHPSSFSMPAVWPRISSHGHDVPTPLPLGGPPPEVLVSPEHLAAYAANCKRTLHYTVNGTLLAKRDHILQRVRSQQFRRHFTCSGRLETLTSSLRVELHTSWTLHLTGNSKSVELNFDGLAFSLTLPLCTRRSGASAVKCRKLCTSRG